MERKYTRGNRCGAVAPRITAIIQGAPDRQRRDGKPKSDIKHGVLQVIVDAAPLFLGVCKHLFLGAFALVALRNEEPAEVASSTLASQVGVIRRRDQANRLCRTNVLVAEVMSSLLQYVDVEVVLVVDDDVVGWSNLPLEARMGLQVEVE